MTNLDSSWSFQYELIPYMLYKLKNPKSKKDPKKDTKKQKNASKKTKKNFHIIFEYCEYLKLF